jgi:hypothetical protein
MPQSTPVRRSMPQIDGDMRNTDRMKKIQTSPLCIAAATCVSVVGISTALFFAAWRLVIVVHQYLFGTPMSQLGVWALVYIMVFAVLPMVVAVSGLCLDRCAVWWHGVLAFFVALSATFYLIASPTLRFLLPVGLVAEGMNSSQRWYWGAILQLAAAFFLLRYFRRSQRQHACNTA